jgi:hypothetical protein
MKKVRPGEEEAQLEEQYSLLESVDKRIGEALDNGKWALLAGLEKERSVIYHDIGFYTVELKRYKEKNPPYENKIRYYTDITDMDHNHHDNNRRIQ